MLVRIICPSLKFLRVIRPILPLFKLPILNISRVNCMPITSAAVNHLFQEMIVFALSLRGYPLMKPELSHHPLRAIMLDDPHVNQLGPNKCGISLKLANGWKSRAVPLVGSPLNLRLMKVVQLVSIAPQMSRSGSLSSPSPNPNKSNRIVLIRIIVDFKSSGPVPWEVSVVRT